jgi:hypothetical protein
MTDEFSKPAAGGRFNAEANKGRLLLITPTSYEQGITTTFGVKDAIRAQVVVINESNPEESEEIDDALLFGGVLITQTKPYIGQGSPVLGRLGQGTAKPGQKPPWRIDDWTEAEAALARKYRQSKAPQL